MKKILPWLVAGGIGVAVGFLLGQRNAKTPLHRGGLRAELTRGHGGLQAELDAVYKELRLCIAGRTARAKDAYDMSGFARP